MLRSIAAAVVSAVLSLAAVGMVKQPAVRADAVHAAPPELPVLPEVRSIAGVAHLALTAALDPTTKRPAFYYRGAPVPPTIRVHPGDTLVVDYTNALPAPTSAFAAPHMSNLHFHGLLISPKAPGDQVITTMLMPGQRYRYVVHIPRDEAPGLYWYHPHPHGESNVQVASGMSGLIVIDGIGRYEPIVRRLPERDIILRDYYLDDSVASLGRKQQRAVMQEAARERAASPTLDASAVIRSVAARAASLPPPTGPNCDATQAAKGVTINGLPEATISMRPGSRQFFRIGNASANSFFDLKLDGSRFLVVAHDGMPLAFHDRAPAGEWLDHVLLPPGGRVEFIAAAPPTDHAKLRTTCVDYGTDGDVDPERVLATIALRGEPFPPPVESGALTPAQMTERPLASASIAARRTVSFTENNPASKFYINGQMWDPTAPPMFVVRAGTLEEWTVLNYADELHAFHIHQIHFFVKDVDGVAQPRSAWRDTVTLPYAHKQADGTRRPSVVHLLMDFRDPLISGTFVFHCHILEHEDGGMMAKIELVNPAGERATARDAGMTMRAMR